MVVKEVDEMVNMQNKISTSIQYQMYKVALFNDVFMSWNSFNEKLNSGPENMKKYLLEMWNIVKNNLKNDNNVIIKDMDKKVTISDFDVTYNRTEKGISFFLLLFLITIILMLQKNMSC